MCLAKGFSTLVVLINYTGKKTMHHITVNCLNMTQVTLSLKRILKKMQLNEPGKKELERQGSRQEAIQTKLYSDRPEDLQIQNP